MNHMKDILKKKMQHVINLHIHVGKNMKEDEESKKTSDMAPMVEDKSIDGAPQNEMSQPMQESMMEDGQPLMSPEEQDGARIKMLHNIGADPDHKNPKSLRGKAMYAAGQEMEKLKSKKLNKK